MAIGTPALPTAASRSADETPGGTWSAPGGIPTGYGFDNTLLASFYVSPATQYAAFYTTDGNPWNVTSSTGGYGQFQFSYVAAHQLRPDCAPRARHARSAGLRAGGPVGLRMEERK